MPSFAHAFGTSEITADRIARALEQFLLTQRSFDSKFDHTLRGEAQFTVEEQRGFELFHTEYDPRREQFGADCFHCHGGPLFQSQSFANNGLDSTFNDLGRFVVTAREGDQAKFAVPSLRNVELTAPYMHDGSAVNLSEVLDHYASGGRTIVTGPSAGVGHDNPLKDSLIHGFRMTARNKADLIAFLESVTDEYLLGSPELADPWGSSPTASTPDSHSATIGGSTRRP